MRQLPDGFPGPACYHLVEPIIGAKLLWRQEHGLHVAFQPSPRDARPPGVADPKTNTAGFVTVGPSLPPAAPPSPWEGPTVPAWRRQPRAETHARTDGRLPRVPRTPRTPRPPRDVRPARAPRARRPSQTLKKVKTPRTPRAPRTPGTKGDAWDYYCGTRDDDGANRQFGAPTRVPRGTDPPPTAPGTHARRVSGTYPCDNDQCDGPLSYVSPWLARQLDLLVNGRYQREEYLVAKIDKARRARMNRNRPGLSPLPLPPPIIDGKRLTYSYCCVCGAVGTCWASGNDCRQMPVLQRSLGQC